MGVLGNAVELEVGEVRGWWLACVGVSDGVDEEGTAVVVGVPAVGDGVGDEEGV